MINIIGTQADGHAQLVVDLPAADDVELLKDFCQKLLANPHWFSSPEREFLAGLLKALGRESKCRNGS